jgi:hypothetical protein
MVDEDISSCRLPSFLVSCEVGITVAFHYRVVATFEVKPMVRRSRKISKKVVMAFQCPFPKFWQNYDTCPSANAISG